MHPERPSEHTAVPYAAWPSPISAADVAKAEIGLGFPTVAGDEVWWEEDRPSEGGRRTIVHRAADGRRRELLAAPWDARTRVHEYGGRSYAAVPGAGVVFANHDDQRLYFLADSAGAEPRPISAEPETPGASRYAEPLIHDGQVWCVRERHAGGKVSRSIVSVPLSGEGGEREWVTGADFYAQPAISPDGEHIAYIAWNHPRMPWTGTELRITRLADGHSWTIKGGTGESVLAPRWRDDSHLYLISDWSGWWNLYQIGIYGTSSQALYPAEEEFAWPLWRLGGLPYLVLGDGRLAVLHGQGDLRLGLLDPESGGLTDLDVPYDGWTPTLDGDGSTLVGIAYGARVPRSVVRVDTVTGRVEGLRREISELPDIAYLPTPRKVYIQGRFGRGVHAVLYPPANPAVASGATPARCACASGGRTGAPAAAGPAASSSTAAPAAGPTAAGAAPPGSDAPAAAGGPATAASGSAVSGSGASVTGGPTAARAAGAAPPSPDAPAAAGGSAAARTSGSAVSGSGAPAFGASAAEGPSAARASGAAPPGSDRSAAAGGPATAAPASGAATAVGSSTASADAPAPPYVLFAHGGPTHHGVARLDLVKAFFTSRGIGVLDVNYGGSTGYGRAYRERLRGQWGVVDVEDVVAAAEWLAAEGLADPARIAIRGGSAGGWTVMAACAASDVFAAGVSIAGVSALAPFVVTTHDFESHYVEWLVGPEDETLYASREPLARAAEVACPMLLMQGLNDSVVPPEQSERFAAALSERGVPCAYLTFEGESHGFRRAETNTAALSAELAFYQQIFTAQDRGPTG